MKMAEGEISREATGEYPVFLLDDVLSELDESRRKYILSSIDKRQVIITSCEPSVFEGKGDNYIRIKSENRCKEIVPVFLNYMFLEGIWKYSSKTQKNSVNLLV